MPEEWPDDDHGPPEDSDDGEIKSDDV